MGAVAQYLGAPVLWDRKLILEHQTRHAEDGVHRRPDLVAHVRQEFAFRLRARLRLASGGVQFGRTLGDALLQAVEHYGEFPVHRFARGQ
jgi:hypothetical protein